MTKQLVALARGRDLFDLDALIVFTEALTGRKPTTEEIEEVRRMLEDARPEIEAALRDQDAH